MVDGDKKTSRLNDDQASLLVRGVDRHGNLKKFCTVVDKLFSLNRLKFSYFIMNIILFQI